MRTRIKFCGCTDVRDAMLAVETGADAIGMIFAPSPRRITEEAARDIAAHLPPFVTPVGVFVNPVLEDIERSRALFPDLAVQLHGDETPEFAASLGGTVVKVLHVSAENPDGAALAREAASFSPQTLLMFDTAGGGARGGTGIAFDWSSIEAIARRRDVIVGGGLTPENVAACVRAVRPFGVDVRSGIETGARKDPLKMRAFVKAVKETDAA